MSSNVKLQLHVKKKTDFLLQQVLKSGKPHGLMVCELYAGIKQSGFEPWSGYMHVHNT